MEVEHLLFTLGTVSSVCCASRDGILNRPVPTPEKLFFFHRRHHHHHHHRHQQSKVVLSAGLSKGEVFDYTTKAKYKSGFESLPTLQMFRCVSFYFEINPILRILLVNVFNFSVIKWFLFFIYY